MLHFNPALDVYYARNENIRRVYDRKTFDREAQLRRKLKDASPTDQRRKFGWRRPFYPAGA